MEEHPTMADELSALIGEQVVVDVRGRHLYIGTLQTVGREVLVLADADVHFCDDSQTTVELYLMEAKKTEIRPNRSSVYVLLRDVLSLSPLDSVIVY